MILIKNGIVNSTQNGLSKKNILVDKGVIIDILDIQEDIQTGPCEVIDAGGNYVLPGFIDIHTHGVNGSDTMTAGFEDLDDMSVFYASKGVTSFLPTTTTSPLVKVVGALENIKLAMGRGTRGARILGINLEGPFISRKYKGAHPEEYIMHPTIELIERLIEKSGNNIRLMTLAPELEGSMAVVEHFREHNIVFSVGHSELGYNGSREAFKRGIGHVTHLFNAMMGIHHREPGLAGAAIDNENVTVEIIADGIHVLAPVVRMVIKCKTPDRVAIVTDSTMAAGLTDGEYLIGDQKIVVKNKEARLPNGVLAGSTLTMVDAVKNLVNVFSVPLEDAVKMAAFTPARIAGVARRKGSLAAGKDADIIIVDREFDVRMTMVEGRVVYRSYK